MKFKEIDIIKDPLFSNIRYIASYHDYMDDDKMLEKFSTCIPRKGDCIKVIDKNSHKDVFLKVKHVFIDYVDNKMTIWCKQH